MFWVRRLLCYAQASVCDAAIAKQTAEQAVVDMQLSMSANEANVREQMQLELSEAQVKFPIKR